MIIGLGSSLSLVSSSQLYPYVKCGTVRILIQPLTPGVWVVGDICIDVTKDTLTHLPWTK